MDTLVQIVELPLMAAAGTLLSSGIIVVEDDGRDASEGRKLGPLYAIIARKGVVPDEE